MTQVEPPEKLPSLQDRRTAGAATALKTYQDTSSYHESVKEIYHRRRATVASTQAHKLSKRYKPSNKFKVAARQAVNPLQEFVSANVAQNMVAN